MINLNYLNSHINLTKVLSKIINLKYILACIRIVGSKYTRYFYFHRALVVNITVFCLKLHKSNYLKDKIVIEHGLAAGIYGSWAQLVSDFFLDGVPYPTRGR